MGGEGLCGAECGLSGVFNIASREWRLEVGGLAGGGWGLVVSALEEACGLTRFIR